MSNHRRLSVRCCCQPQKVLGTLPYGGSPYCEQFKYVEQASPVAPSREPDAPVSIRENVVNLEVHDFTDPKSGVHELAYKAEGISIEVLRKLPGFVEARQLYEPRWVSVNDRLPPGRKHVWCLNSDGRQFEGCVCYGMHHPFFTLPHGDGSPSNTEPSWIDVTHWRSLPALPGQEENHEGEVISFYGDDGSHGPIRIGRIFEYTMPLVQTNRSALLIGQQVREALLETGECVMARIHKDKSSDVPTA